MTNHEYHLILDLSRTTYFDSLTGITESESGEPMGELKITGRPELHKRKKRKLKMGVMTKRGINVICLFFTENGKMVNGP